VTKHYKCGEMERGTSTHTLREKEGKGPESNDA